MKAAQTRALPTPYDRYRVLGLRPGATHHDVQEAYRKLAFKHHPDIAGEDPHARAEFIRITQAYRIISTLDRVKGLAGKLGGACQRCGEVGELFPGLDRRNYCTECLLATRRRLLPLPGYRAIRCGLVIALQTAALAYLGAFVWHGDSRHAWTALGAASASLVVLGWHVRVADQIEG